MLDNKQENIEGHKFLTIEFIFTMIHSKYHSYQPLQNNVVQNNIIFQDYVNEISLNHDQIAEVTYTAKQSKFKGRQTLFCPSTINLFPHIYAF